MMLSFVSSRSIRFLQSFVAVLALIVFASVLASAQNASTGAVLGTVTDPSGAVVTGAEVTLTSVATNQSTTAKSNSSGQFTFPSVAPGDYRLTVKAEGFQTASVTGVTV